MDEESKKHIREAIKLQEDAREHAASRKDWGAVAMHQDLIDRLTALLDGGSG